MSINIYELLAYERLEEAILECEPYDDYSKEEQLKYFISKNGFNPITELKILEHKLFDKYLKDFSLDMFENFKQKSYIQKLKIINYYLEDINSNLYLNNVLFKVILNRFNIEAI